MSRLTVEDKNRFIKGLTRNLCRIQETIPYPLASMSDEDLLEFVEATIPIEVREAVETLRGWKKSNINNILTSRVSLVLQDSKTEVMGTIHLNLPREVIASRRTVSPDIEPELYTPLCEYVLHRRYADYLAGLATVWVEGAVKSCTSVGQLKRALPDFSPLFTDWMRETLRQAQRASRMPKDFPHDMYAQTLALNTITLTSLLPPERAQLPTADTGFAGNIILREMKEKKQRVFEWQPASYTLPS